MTYLTTSIDVAPALKKSVVSSITATLLKIPFQMDCKRRKFPKTMTQITQVTNKAHGLKISIKEPWSPYFALQYLHSSPWSWRSVKMKNRVGLMIHNYMPGQGCDVWTNLKKKTLKSNPEFLLYGEKNIFLHTAQVTEIYYQKMWCLQLSPVIF